VKTKKTVEEDNDKMNRKERCAGIDVGKIPKIGYS
jgi:hypothetical protein